MAYEPTISIALHNGKYKVLHGSVFAEVFDRSPMIGSLVNSNFAALHPKLLAKIKTVYDEAQAYALSHPEDTRRIIAQELNISMEAAENLSISPLSDIDPKRIQEFIDVLFDLGELKVKPALSSILYE
jgi:ABC-type nitrate/sulfonate/bicarbonate transport system substrate-binding protein